MSDSDCHCSECCDECAEIVTLRAQLAAVENERDGLSMALAAVEKERDEALADAAGWKEALDTETAHRHAANDSAAKLEADLARERDQAQPCARMLLVEQERRAKLEAALDISDGAVLHSRWCRECAEGDPCADIADAIAQVSARARVRAGLTKEGK